MAENPLLPNAELRALHKLLKQASGATTSRPSSQDGAIPFKTRFSAQNDEAEALRAATLLQLRAGDLLVADEPQATPFRALLEAPWRVKPFQGASVHTFPPDSPGLLLASGLACALRRSGKERLVLAFTQAAAAPSQWADALTWAQKDLLPLIVVCADPSGSEAFRPAPKPAPDTLEWASMQRTANRLKLPVLSVDGEDAVAVYRVMQESVLRVRSGAGPTVLWAVLPQPRRLKRTRTAAATPLDRLEHYMRTRKIAVSP